MRNFANFMGRNSILILLVSLLFTSSCATKLSKVLKSKDVEYKYKMAEQYYANKNMRKRKRSLRPTFLTI